MRKTLFAMTLALVMCVSGYTVRAQQAVLQRGYDAGLTGANLAETTLTTSNVNPTTFGRVFNLLVDDKIYAQPLYVPQVGIPNQGIHNVVYVATMSDSLYAFDADVGGSPLWVDNFATSVGAVPVSIAKFAISGNTNITGNLGILSTPVIDASSNILYLVACTLESGTMVYRLHAVNIADGTEPYPNVVISGSHSGVNFTAVHQTQRVSLTVSGDQVVFAFGAIEAEADDEAGYAGWVMAYDKHTLAQTGLYATITSGSTLGGGVWQSGRAPVVDGSGFVYLFTGNGWNTNGYNGTTNFAESALRLDPANGLALVDWFTPQNWNDMDQHDLDLSSSGPLLVPNTSPSLLAGGGKTGVLYLLNTSDLGQFSTTDSGVLQEVTIGASSLRGGPVWWQRSAANGGPVLYDWATKDAVKAFAFNGTTFGTAPTSAGSGSQVYPGGILALSANGQQQGTGVLWATLATSGDVYDDTTDPGALYAFDAGNVANQLYSSTTNASRDSVGTFGKLVPPMVANGRVYVATFSDQVAVYGLLSPTTPAAATPTFSPAPGTYTGTQQVALSDATNGAVIYYTTNGTTPTTASAQYVAGTPLSVSASETIEALAVASGYGSSAVASGTYTISALPAAATPTFSPPPGTYTGAQQVALSDATSGAVIYYTTNGTTPTTASAQYVSGTPLSVGATETLKAIAVASGYTTSAVASGTYTISAAGSGPVSVSLSTADNIVGLGTVGTAVSNGGLDQGGHAYAANLLGTSVSWSGSTFALGGANVADMVSSTTLMLPPGSYTTLNMLGTGINGDQNASFVVTYTDGTTTKITQTLSDWFAPANHTGESIVSSMAYRINPDGTADNRTFNLYGYSFALNGAKTVKSLTLPTNRNIVVLAIDLVPTSGSSPPAATTPTFSPAPGTYTGTQQVALSDATSGAVIYYTTNGTTPTTASAQYVSGTPLSVSASETIEALAVASGYGSSAVASGTYTISALPAAATPTFSPPPGTYTGTQQVALSDATSGAVIYYTTNGTTPTTASAQYVSGTPLSVGASETIEALAVASGYTTSAVASGTYTISAAGSGPVSVSLSTADNIVGLGTVGTAVSNGGLDQGGHAYAANLLGTSVSWSGSTFALGGANVADMVSSTTLMLPPGSYTSLKMLATGINGDQNASFVVTYTDGTTTKITQTLSDWFAPANHAGESIVSSMAYRINPDGTADNRTFNLYGYSFALNGAKTVKSLTLPTNRNIVVLAIDLVPTSGSSPPAATTPTFSPAPGTYTGTQQVALSDATSGAVIYYTTNGTTPTTASAQYVSGTPLSVSASETIEALAVASGYGSSAVASGTYTISALPAAATPTFSPPPGTYTGTQQVALSDATSGAVIYYTTNGTTPTTASAQYVSGTPLSVGATETLKAIAVASGYTTSAMASGTYTISATAVAATPTFSPAPGTYTGTQQVVLSDATSGAVIYYTTNGMTPTTASAQYVSGTPLSVSATETLEAVAVASGYSTSAVASGTYTISAGTGPVSVSLSTADDIFGLGTVGTAVSNGGLDQGGHAYAANLLGTSVSWSGSTFAIGGANVADMVSSATLTLPPGSYTSLKMLATGINGDQNAIFVVTYTDGTTTKITQTLSDWFAPANHAGESIVSSMAYRINPDGTADNRTFNLYGYSFALNGAKTVKSVTLPNNRNIVALAVDLVP